ncbi:IS481 family transposase (plasmid) [Mycolicibacterium aichiense]|uniref:IS481 family transposase n=1 Tax=Mycolicibacterium aichiense TaxID=1799 RepID=UPI003D672C89
MTEQLPDSAGDWVIEHRYRAVLQVLDGVSKSQVARECGASRQSVHSWVIRYEALGLPGLADRSRRPLTSPNELSPTVVAMVCELRLTYPRWGAQRIAHELALRGVDAPPSRSSVYRILVRHGLVAAQQQNHKRKYRRWQRDAPMQLWQIDIMGGVFLFDGRECKLVTGIDDHARFVVMATVVAEPGARAVCAAFTAAMATYGVPSEVLTDNGKQFTGRFTKPYPAEVLFERICRENGITTRLTKPRSPTTTGKIERLHKTLRREFLDSAGPFASIEAAQDAIDAWVRGYNHSRPHQSLGMATPATVFRPAPVEVIAPVPIDTEPLTPDVVEVVVPPRPKQHLAPVAEHALDGTINAVEWEAALTPRARLLLPGDQQFKFTAALARREVTVWASDRSIHIVLDGTVIRTRPSRLSEHDLRDLLRRGARIAGPEPARGAATAEMLSTSAVIEVARTVSRDGCIGLGGDKVLLESTLVGQRVTLRFEGSLMHVVANGRLVKTLPAPLPPNQRPALRGARPTSEPLPPPAPPHRAMRRVAANGTITVAGQRLRIGRSHQGRTVTIAIEDTVFRVFIDGNEICTHARRTNTDVAIFKAYPRRPST